MKEIIIDTLVKGIVFGALVMFGLRGILPDIAAAGDMPALFFGGAAAIALSAVGSAVYRCAYRCETPCEPAVCRIR